MVGALMSNTQAHWWPYSGHNTPTFRDIKYTDVLMIMKSYFLLLEKGGTNLERDKTRMNPVVSDQNKGSVNYF